tara:strand:+ start:185 stop:697 length:513 start_codon:yes stop_codon:yes gene_type:complete
MKQLTFFAICSLLVPLTVTALAGQTFSGCTKVDLQDPPRSVYQCAGGVTLEAEAATALGIQEREDSGRPTEVDLSSDGLYIEIDPGSGAFQIQTPHAIAAVRGTVYVVDVTETGTEVFVREGEVSVSRADGTNTVILTPGFGINVAPGEMMESRRWPQERVDSLLDRFGR